MVTSTSKNFEDFLDHFTVNFVIEFKIFMHSTNELNLFYNVARRIHQYTLIRQNFHNLVSASYHCIDLS